MHRSALRAAYAALALGASVCTAATTAAQATAQPLTGGYVGPFNNHDQGHADLCVKLRSPAAPLRYLNGVASGFELTNENLAPSEGAENVPCPAPGMARLDAREIVKLVDGRTMLFHRGAVYFGHILTSDIDTVGVMYVPADTIHGVAGRWVPSPTRPWIGVGQQAGNGSPCAARESIPSRISVQSLPGDMKYLNARQTNATAYAIYGDPSRDLGTPEDRARGVKYTMLTWSWINVRGGGAPRALMYDGEAFYPCSDVPVVQLTSVADAESRTPTGWVAAVYGAVRAGDGSWLYGWTVSAHRHKSDAPVMHLRP